MKFILSILLFLSFSLLTSSQKKYNSFRPGEIWEDNNGVHINAHGGGFLFHKGIYYWYGEHKIAGRIGNTAQVGVHCYSSKDLYNWVDEGIALKVVENNANHDIAKGCVIERPKVIFNKKSGKFVMWFHLELKGKGYSAAKTGVAVSDRATEPFAFIRSLNPNAGVWPVGFTENQIRAVYPDTLKSWTNPWKEAVKNGMFVKKWFEKGQMSRDMGLFIDDDGKAYHIHAAEDNLTIHISELTDDYLGFTGKYIRVLPTGHNEAPAMFKYHGNYYMITSGCTGWDPNAARLLRSRSVMGEWEYLGNPCDGKDAELTFHGQSTFVLPLHGKRGKFIFMADRWVPGNPIDGRYIWLPIKPERDRITIEWKDEWNLKDL